MSFNKDQEESIEQIHKFLSPLNPAQLFLLNGAAGTGKTYVISRLFNEEKFKFKRIAFTAPTNKAVSIIRLLNPIVSKNVSYITTHKLLGITRQIDDDGSINFIENETQSQSNGDTLEKVDYVIIDEASMVSQSIYETLLKKLKITKNPVKVIFVGDIHQLPPVNEEISSVFSKVKTKSNLKIIERYKNSIVTYANSIRNNIRIKKSQLEEDVSFIKDEKVWLDDYIKNYQDSIILAYTNKKVESMNDKIRNTLFDNVSQKFNTNEKIVFNNYYYYDNNSFYSSQIGIITNLVTNHLELEQFPKRHLMNSKISKDNNDDNLLTKTKKLEEPCPICYEEDIDDCSKTDCGHKFCSTCIKLWLENHNQCPMCRFTIKTNGEIDIKNDTHLTSLVNDFCALTQNTLLKVYHLTIDIENETGRDIIVLHEDSQEEYDALKNKFIDILSRMKKNIYKRSRNYFNKQLMISLWNFYYDKYVDIFANISYGYAMTVHKSQGSTYKNVYLHLKNIMINKQELKQCIYTGVTRASNSIKVMT